MLPHADGVSTFGTALSEDRRTIADQLNSAGYHTAAFGKMGFMRDAYPGIHGLDVAMVEGVINASWKEEVQPKPPAPGVKTKPRARAHQDPTRLWLNCDNLPAPYYAADMPSSHTARKAVEYLEQQGDDPFALWVSFGEPHNPFDFPIEYAGRYNPADFELPPLGPDDKAQIPLLLRELTDDDMRGAIAAYYTSASFLDENVGVVTDAITRLGLDDNTLVVYWGDHGFLLGEHGRIYKHCLYDPALRPPLLMSCPGRIRNGVVDDFTESVDIPATILDFLDVYPIPGMQGLSLVPYLEDGTSSNPRDHIFSEFLHNEEACVRTSRWKFIHCTGKRFRNDGYETENPTPGRYVRLYDLEADPGELLDVSSDNPAVVSEMTELMLTRFRETHPEAADEPAGEPPEILDWYLRPRDESRGM
jgi:choline-sulfatase